MAYNIQKTHCKQGHELTPENTRQTYTKSGAKDGRKCLKCSANRIARYRKIDPAKLNLQRTNSAIKMKFGIDGVSGREQLLTAQGGKCKICWRTDCHWGKGFTNVWHIDHDHATGEVRGVLCADCNTFVGQVEKHAEILGIVTQYLEI